jgi:hypothetical protein
MRSTLIGVSQEHIDKFEAGAFEQAGPPRDREVSSDARIVARTQ